MPIGLFTYSDDWSSITSRCLTLFCSIISTASDDKDLDLTVIKGEDIISLFIILLVYISLIQTLLTKSRSVIKPSGLSFSSTTTNELTFFSFILLAASWTEADSLIVSILFLIKSLTVSVIIYTQMVIGTGSI